MNQPSATTAQAPQPTQTREVPFNLFKQAEPLTVTLLENTRLTRPESPNDVRHLVFNIDGTGYRYVDGQSAGILPPGSDAAGKSHKLRLYSIASPGFGDDGEGKTFSLCVKRVVYQDEATGEERRGVCSNYLCDLAVGDAVKVTGPVGKAFLLPETPHANLIMIATGTGVAPFRGFLRTRYLQNRHESGQAWLFFGAQYESDYLYAQELESYREYPTYHLVTAFSREQQTAAGKRMYVQHRLYEHRQELFALLEQPNTYLYICGLKGMESGILEALEQAAAETGKSWQELYSRLNTEKRWLVEVY